jgi:hypothetical protein
MNQDEKGRFIGQEKGVKNPAWKGENASITTIHEWVRNNFIKSDNCEICNRDNDGSIVFDWSNKDHKYSRERKDWQHVCRSCHNKYDLEHNGRVRPYSKRKYDWSWKYERCISCNRNNVKYKAAGKCSSCYQNK